MTKITYHNPQLYNKDLAPTLNNKKSWGWFEIFNVWANDIQSLFGYILVTSLFLTYGLNGWAIFGAIILAGFFIMLLVNLSGKPSVKYGIPYPVFARVSMGVIGAKCPAMIRGIVAIFWYGAQTYLASTALSLLLNSLLGTANNSITFIGLTCVNWISLLSVGIFQIYLFWHGINFIKRFLNFAAPTVYIVMILMIIIIWYKTGDDLFVEVGRIFQGSENHEVNSIKAFFAIFSIIVAYFAAVVINFGDFSCYVKDEKQMKKGNFLGLIGNLILFSFMTLTITAGTAVLFGETVTNPSDLVAKMDSLTFTVVAIFAFFTATIGVNMVANFIPSAYNLANLIPKKISFRKGGLITAVAGFILAVLWASIISKVGLYLLVSYFSAVVNTLGAILAPVYGIMMVDYYLIKKQKLDIQQLFSTDPDGKYYYNNGWNKQAMLVMTISTLLTVITIWHPALANLSGFSWIIGALIGGIFYLILAKIKTSNNR